MQEKSSYQNSIITTLLLSILIKVGGAWYYAGVICTHEAYYTLLFCTLETTLLWWREKHIFAQNVLIICTFMPFSKSNNLIHTAHNGTEWTLNEKEDACLDYVKRADFYCPYSHRLARVKTRYFWPKTSRSRASRQHHANQKSRNRDEEEDHWWN